MKLKKATLSLLLGLSVIVQCNITSRRLQRESVGTGIVTVKIVAFNDFHGQLQSPGGFRRMPGSTADQTFPVGGVDWMAGYIAELKAKNRHTVVVSAGDIIGATPLISALFHDEGSIETMNRLGLDFNAVGNHEFDEGKQELLRMQSGGCHPTDINSCRGAEVGTPVPFEGAQFQFLAANVIETKAGETLFPAFGIKTIAGVRIAFIGMTLKETPSIVKPQGVAGLVFKDEAETVNSLIPLLHERGVNAIVLLIHQGGVLPVAQTESGINSCEGGLEVGSPIKAIVNRLDDGVDLVISGHTHQAYNCRIANRAGRLLPVTSANALGRVLTDIDLKIDPLGGEVLEVTATNFVVDQRNKRIRPDQAIKSIVDNYADIARPLADRVIGRISETISHTPNVAGESALGDVLADAQLAATAAKGAGNAEIAFINPGAVRTALIYPSSIAGEGDGRVTYGEAFAVQPFGTSLVTLTLTGAQLHTLLEQQFTACTMAYPVSAPASGQPFNRILQVSQGFSYTWQEKGTPCDNVDPAGMLLNGNPIQATGRYRVAVNSYLAAGGDRFYVLTEGSDRLGGPQDMDALQDYFKARALIRPGPQNRITRLP